MFRLYLFKTLTTFVFSNIIIDDYGSKEPAYFDC